MANDFNLDQFPLPKDWTRQELIDCTEDGNISYGIVQPGKHLDEGIPVLRVNNIGNNSLDLDAVMKVDPKIEEKYLRTRLLGGEVLLTLVGSTGQSIIAPEYMKGWNVARAIAVIRADENIGADWINICLQSRETHHYLNSRANTTVQKTLNLKDVRSIPIPIPPLKTKLFIENIATSLSKKIELNRQMNETLEAMAQALFKSWFVDFDPVIDNALAAGNAIPDEFIERAEQRKGIEKKDDLDIQKLFPDEFEFTEGMGWIPKGWEVKPLDEVANYLNGLALQKFRPENIDDDYLPVVKIAQLREGLPSHDEKASINIKPEYIIDNGDVIFSWSGSLLVDIWCGGEAALNQHLFKVTSDKYPKWFYLNYTKHHLTEFQRIATDKAVTMGHIKRGHLKEALCLIPKNGVDDNVFAVFEDILSKQISSRIESQTLAKLRDTLLPKLMSGELRIPDATTILEDV